MKCEDEGSRQSKQPLKRQRGKRGHGYSNTEGRSWLWYYQLSLFSPSEHVGGLPFLGRLWLGGPI